MYANTNVTKMGSALGTDWPFTDPKWIKPAVKIRAFRPHKDRTSYRIYQGPSARVLKIMEHVPLDASRQGQRYDSQPLQYWS